MKMKKMLAMRTRSTTEAKAARTKDLTGKSSFLIRKTILSLRASWEFCSLASWGTTC